MTITLKLFASLVTRLPPESRRHHRVFLDIDPGTTVQNVIDAQGIPDAQCAIVLVNGVRIGRADRDSRMLSDGEVVAVWPPVV